MKATAQCPVCGAKSDVEIVSNLELPKTNACENCQRTRLQTLSAKAGLPVGGQSCTPADEAKMRGSYGAGDNYSQCGGGRRIVRKSEPMAG